MVGGVRLMLFTCALVCLAAAGVAAEPAADLAAQERERLRRPAPEWTGTLDELVEAVRGGGVRIAIDSPQGAVDDPRLCRVLLPTGRRTWEDAVRLAGWQAGLVLCQMPDGLRLVDPRQAPSAGRAYAVADLLTAGDAESAAALETLARSPGPIGKADAAVWNGQLVVNGSEAHHQRLEGMLAALRTAPALTAGATLWSDEAAADDAPREGVRAGRGPRHWRDAPLDRIVADLRTDGVAVVVQARPVRRMPLVSAEWDPRTQTPAELMPRIAAAAGMGVDRLAACYCFGDPVGGRELRWHPQAGAADQSARLRVALKVLLAGDRAGEPAIAPWRKGLLVLASRDRQQAAAAFLAPASASAAAPAQP